MRLLVLVLAVLTLATQYPLWWGKGGWLRVQELQAQIATQQEGNQALAARNNALLAEVQDLKSGTSAIEERARGELLAGARLAADQDADVRRRDSDERR